MKETNLALLGRWSWRIGDGSEALWKQLIVSNFGIPRDGWEVRDQMPRYSTIWKGNLASKEMFFKNIRYRVGEGDSLFFSRPLGGGQSTSNLLSKSIQLCY